MPATLACMKPLARAILAIAIFLTPVGAMADNPAAGSPNFQAMQQVRARIEQLHAQSRISTLNALSATHRSLLAQVASQLSIAANPDPGAAAKQLDAALSSSESKAILDIATSTEQQVRQVIDSARQQMGGGNTQGPPPMGRFGSTRGASENDPGTILLMMAARSLSPSRPFGHM